MGDQPRIPAEERPAAPAGAHGEESPARASRARRRWARLGGALLGLAVLAALAAVLGDRWRELSRSEFRPHVGVLAATVPLFVLSIGLLAVQWRAVVRALGGEMSLATAVRVHFLAQVAKYVPGKVVLLAGKAFLGLRAGLGPRVAVLSVAYEQVFTLVAGALVVLVAALGAAAPIPVGYRIGSAVLLGLGLLSLHPAVFRLLLRVASRLLSREGEIRVLPVGASARLLVGYALAWTFTGGVFYVVVRGVYPLPVRYVGDCVGILVLGVLAGFLAVITPAGLGVREATVSAMLSAYMPLPVAIAIALALRVVVTATEAVCFLIALGLGRRAAAVELQKSPVQGNGT